MTAYQAAVEAGLRRRKRPLEVDTNAARRREFRRHPGRATRDLEMWLGPGSSGSAFVSEKEQRAYWRENRDRILLMHGGRARRPWGFWRYDSPVAWPGYDRERSVLYVEGLLDDVEARELLAYWHEQFERANSPDFVYHWNGRLLRGAVARRQHYQHIDIPLEEAVAFTNERRRAARVIRAMQPAA